MVNLQINGSPKSGIAIDPTTVVVKECILISSSMRKLSKYSQSGVAAILSGSTSDLFNDELELNKFGLNSNGSGNNTVNDPLLSGFIQLRLMLNNSKDLNEIDSLTLLQPFLLVIKSSSTTGNITSLALDSLSKFIGYGIVSKESKNLPYTLTYIVNSLTHCRFEASEQSSDDAVLLKVLRLLETIIDSDLGHLLSDEVIYEVVQTSLSLACNKRRSEVLLKAAELSMYSISKKIFARLDDLEHEHSTFVVEETHDYSKNHLLENIGPGEGINLEKKSLEVLKEAEQPFGIIAIKQYLGILISMIAPENQLKHNESTKVFALSLITTAVELSSDRFPNFPSLLNLIADPVFKHTLHIIQTVNSIPVLQAALQLFTTITLTLGEYLQPQIELTLRSIFSTIEPAEKPKDKTKSGKSTTTDTSLKGASAKELIVEEISILWTRSPNFFIDLFINYDTNFHRHDLAIQFFEFLAKLSLPESALHISDSIPPIALEGLLSFIQNLDEEIKLVSNFSESPLHELLLNKQKKKEFITATNIFNSKPKDGLKVLQEKGFIQSAEDIKGLALFFFEKSGRLNKKVLGEYLAKPSNSNLLKEFLDLFDFKDLRVDEALRILLKSFRLPGESQQIERIVETFAARYIKSQGYTPDELKASELPEETTTFSEADLKAVTEEPVRPDADAVFVLSYSIIMLNTDLHNPVIKAHMTIDDYKKNLRGVYYKRDFPSWYLEKIYQSIKDKEIVMPEEHHGSSQFFDDSWNNLISANIALPIESHKLDEFSINDKLQFQKYIVQNTASTLLNVVFQIFEVAVDDQVITKMMTTIDHLSQIFKFFKLDDLSNNLITKLTELTTLTGKKRVISTTANINTSLKLTRIKVEGGEVINVSETAVEFGSDFKAQLSTVVLFRIVTRNLKILNSESWSSLLEAFLKLLQNGLVDSNLFPTFQKQYDLPKLPGIKPEVILTRSAATKGFLSTFASYLKGEDEPTDDVVETTLSALDCVKSANIASLFEELESVELDFDSLILTAISFLPESKADTNKSYFEAQLFFLLELITSSISVSTLKQSTIQLVIEKVDSLLKSSEEIKLTKALVLRLAIYKLIIVSKAGEFNKETLTNDFNLLSNFDTSLFEKFGKTLLKPITDLAHTENIQSTVLNNETYWKILRQLASISDYTKTIFNFTETLVKESISSFNELNFMWLLGLLDEISAVGAIGGQWEQEYDNLVKTGHKVTKENPYQFIVQTSLQSIKFTASLLNLKPKLSKDETYALIQALAHQCLNPCFQIRSYALTSLEETVLQVQINEELTPQGIFELGLFPLLNEEIEKYEVLALLSKVYIHFAKLDQTDNQIFLKILDIYNQYLEDPKIESEMQKLIKSKKELEKNDKSSEEDHGEVAVEQEITNQDSNNMKDGGEPEIHIKPENESIAEDGSSQEKTVDDIDLKALSHSIDEVE